VTFLQILFSTYFTLWAAFTPLEAHASYSGLPTELVCIAQHESGIRQFDAKGRPIWSKTNDVGIFQLHKSWIPVAKKEGLDIVNSAEDNVQFAIELYNKDGGKPWTTDKYCHGSEAS
jgi:transglycosylase-like protein with SLT domain